MQIYAILDWTSSWVPKAGYSYGTWMVYNGLNMPMIKQNNLIDALLRQGEKHRSFNDLRTKATGYGWQPWREHETWICSYLMVLYGVVSVLPLTLQALSRQWPVKLGNFNGIQIPTHTQMLKSSILSKPTRWLLYIASVRFTQRSWSQELKNINGKTCEVYSQDLLTCVLPSLPCI